ncbi:MAG: AAA family ATPase [Alcaligenaceae bacterium]|nr:AAA family ATPase [Alcaligenaceae bacterium]
MLKQLNIKNLTLFPNEHKLSFAAGLNVFVGENGTGKTHLMKMAYSLIAASQEASRKQEHNAPTKAYLQKAYADKLLGVFKPDALGRLVSRKQGRARCEVSLEFDNTDLNTRISFATNATSDVKVEVLPMHWDEQPALFIPTRELMTIYPGFVALYDMHHVPFEETWRDTCLHLAVPQLKGRRSAAIADLLGPLEKAMGGRVFLDKSGQFYLTIQGTGSMEMQLVSEGLRKLAMLAQLIGNGVLQENGYVFWDEPESNLNPKLIKLIAEVIYSLATNGIQVFIATHSLFLLRELEIISINSINNKDKKFTQRYFAMKPEGNGILIEQGDELTDLHTLTLLDEALQQSDRYMDIQ